MKKNRQRGFSLIEVLISIFVLALGVIGTAGMQLVAMRTSQQSSLQSVAVQLATEMADKMRSNSKQMNQTPDSAIPFLQIDHDSSTMAAPTAPSSTDTCYGATGCNDAKMAAFDIYEWLTRVRNELPGGRAKVCRDASPSTGGVLTWDCAYTAATGNNAPFVIKVGWQGKNPDGTLIRDADKKFPPSIAITVEPYVK
jgi:type IV pilus assembly protein PilV